MKKEELVPIGTRIQKWIRKCMERESKERGDIGISEIVRDSLEKRYKGQKPR